jgi:hypothetical protein
MIGKDRYLNKILMKTEGVGMGTFCNAHAEKSTPLPLSFFYRSNTIKFEKTLRIKCKVLTESASDHGVISSINIYKY